MIASLWWSAWVCIRPLGRRVSIFYGRLFTNPRVSDDARFEEKCKDYIVFFNSNSFC